MGRSPNLGKLVCGSVSYTLVLSFHMILPYSRVSTVDLPPKHSIQPPTKHITTVNQTLDLYAHLDARQRYAMSGLVPWARNNKHPTSR